SLRLMIFKWVNLGTQKRCKLSEFLKLRPGKTFSKDKQALVGHLDDFMNSRQGTDAEKIGRLRRVNARFALGHHEDGLFFAKGINKLNRTLAPHRQRQYRMRKQDGVPDWQYGHTILPYFQGRRTRRRACRDSSFMSFRRHNNP